MNTRASSAASFQMSRHQLPSALSDTYVISGCSRGIGLEFTRQLLHRSQGSVIGLSRQKNSPALNELKTTFGERIHFVEVDLENQDSIDAAGTAVAAITGQVKLLINTAGILGDSKTTPGPERTITQIDRDWLQKTLDVNLIGHVMMTKALTPLLKQKKKDTTDKADEASSGPSKIVNLSARVGSIGDNSLGGWYSYRMSKAGLNMFTKTCSIELKR
jgi:NAD(P)-dependent dehydrogenase (short-subunit alcohol dehydrogenase family)